MSFQIIFALLTFGGLALPGRSVAQAADEKTPTFLMQHWPAFDNNFHLENLFNIARRSEEYRTAQTIWIYAFDVPGEYVDSGVPTDPEFARVTHPDASKVRVFTPERTSAKAKELETMQGAPPTAYQAVRVAGWKGYAVFDPKNPSLRPFAVKLQAEEKQDGITILHNSPHFTRIAVSNFRTLHELHEKIRDPLVEFIPEPHGAVVEMANGKSFTNLFRELPEAETAETRIYPLHAFLGSGYGVAYNPRTRPLVKRAADLAGKSPTNWLMTEFGPKLGQLAARLNFRYGVMHEGHTQNFYIRIDKRTGQIRSFLLKDFGDLFFEKRQLDKLGVAPPATAAERRGEQVADKAVEYFGQTIYSIFSGNTNARTLISNEQGRAALLTRIALASYFDEVARITGVKADWSSEEAAFLRLPTQSRAEALGFVGQPGISTPQAEAIKALMARFYDRTTTAVFTRRLGACTIEEIAHRLESAP